MSTAGDGIEARLAAVEAELAIRKLIARYMFAVDDRDLEALRALFTEDARLSSADGVLDARGREAILALYQQRFDALGFSNHFAHDVVIELEGEDRATGVVSAHAELWRNEVQQLAALRYQDRYARQDGRWRLAERRMLYVYYAPFDRYGALLGSVLRNFTHGEPKPADAPERSPAFPRPV